MARQWAVPKRYINIQLFDGRSGGYDSTKILSEAGIDAKISFTTQAVVYGMTPQANVNIVGLKRDTMGYLASSYTSWLKSAVNNKIIIDAGYEGNHSVIFEGTVVEGIPDLSTADFNISLKALSLQNYMKKVSSISEKDEVDVKEIAKKIASDLDVQLVSFPEGEHKLKNYVLTDIDPINQMRYLAKTSGLDIYIDNGRMYAKEKGKEANGAGSLQITPEMIIGAPQPTGQGCRLQIRMNPYIKGGMKVSLESKRFPLLNSSDAGNYFVASYSHSGDTKGKKWLTDIELTKTNLYMKG